MAFEHIPEMVSARIRSSPKLAAFRVKRDGVFVDVTWAEVAPRIDAIAAGLLTAANLDDGACVTIVGSTGMDWIIADFAALSVGLKTVPVYASLLPEEVGFMHADTAAQLCIVENAAQLEKVRTAGRALAARSSGRGSASRISSSSRTPASPSTMQWCTLTRIAVLPSCVTADNPSRYQEPITAQGYLEERLREIKLK